MKAKDYLKVETMKCKYHLEPWPEHCACLVDLLGRANCLADACHFVKNMQIEPPAEVWCALLGVVRFTQIKNLDKLPPRSS
jgi:hypothetical protein